MNRYKITYIVDEGETEAAYITERTEAAARKVFKTVSKGREITDVELYDTNVPATKEQERETLSKIKQMVEELGPQSYLATAFRGAFEDAEQNIEDDAAYSWYDRAESATKRAEAAEDRLKELGGLVDSLKEQLRQKEIKLAKYSLPADLYRDLWMFVTDEAKVRRHPTDVRQHGELHLRRHSQRGREQAPMGQDQGRGQNPPHLRPRHSGQRLVG